nr:hypothetical protein [uncultured Pseudomonas sp.]
MELPPTIILTAIAGFALSVGWLITYLFANLARKAWNWIDDNDDPVKRNPILDWLMPRLGYQIDQQHLNYGGKYIWEKNNGKDTSNGDIAIFMPFLILLVFPTAIYIGLWLYPVTLTGIALFLIAYLARFARRHRKLFDKHLKDPDAHR